MAHALGGVLAMLFWIWFRRRYGGGKTLIAVAVMIVLVAAAARAETGPLPPYLSVIPPDDREVMIRAYREMKECEPNPDSPKCQKRKRDYQIGKRCGILLGLTQHDPDQKVPWTPRRQKECEHAAKRGELDLWYRKHAEWWKYPETCERVTLDTGVFLICPGRWTAIPMDRPK